MPHRPGTVQEPLVSASGTRYGGFGGFGGAVRGPVRQRAVSPKPSGVSARAIVLPVLPVVVSAVLLVCCCGFVLFACLFRAWYSHVAEARVLASWARVQHRGPVASLDQMRGSGVIALVPIGAPGQAFRVDGLAEWLHAKYQLDVHVLPVAPPDRAAWDSQRSQYVSELLCEQLERLAPQGDAGSAAAVIGITDETMYQARGDDELSYTTRCGERAAVISTYGFQRHSVVDRWLGTGTPISWVDARVRRFLLKDVALLYWHLQLNNDLTSVLHNPLNPDVPAEDVYETDLQPTGTRWGASVVSPCLYFTYSAKAGMQPLPGAAVRDCEAASEVSNDETEELFEVDLQNAVVRTKRTDLYLADSIPLRLQRVLRPGGTNPTEFGASGSHSYDKYLWANHMTELHVVGPEFRNDFLYRKPVWLPVESLNRWVDGDSGRNRTMTYHLLPHERFDLKDLHGNVESYLPCDGPEVCYLDGMRNAQGEELRFERSGQDRKLLRVNSPHGGWLRFTYDGRDRLIEIDDSLGRSVHYGYNVQDQLVSVTRANGEITRYEYDSEQRLLSFSVAPNAGAPPQELLRNTYDPAGRLIRQSLPGGAVYSYTHHAVADRTTHWVTVATPDGRTFEVYEGQNHGSLIETSGDSSPAGS